MRLVGHYDAQGRALYQPNFIPYPDGKRIIAFLGTHSTQPNPLPNPLNGNAMERNGTLIVDITDPRHPDPQFHIPGTGTGDLSMVRMCLGSQLPGGTAGKVYLLRSFDAGYESWDVTNTRAPVKLATFGNIRSTHKLWWECNTGIAYMPGSKDATYGLPLWRDSQSMLIVDWSNPASPKYIRTYGLVGGQPNGTGPVPPALHGAISAHEHPLATQKLVHGATADDIIGNRIYAAYGVGSNGVNQIIDRKQLLPPAYGGVYKGDPDLPSDADILAAQVGYFTQSPDQGGHTTMPVFGQEPKSLQDVNAPQVRDLLLIASEAGSCTSHHWAFIADISTENSFGVRQDPWQGPMVLSTLRVDPSTGENYVRGNYCFRGQRFGNHSVEENFRNPFYGRMTFTSYFNAGVRAWDIRDPMAPIEVGFYVPDAPNNTYMTNNVEVDNRGYILIVDRIGQGFDILELTGRARQIGFDQ